MTVAPGMKYESAPLRDAPHYIADPEWHLQQKLDGIRVMLRLTETGVDAWSQHGTPLASTTAAPVTTAAAAALQPFTEATDGPLRPGVVLDAEAIRDAKRGNRLVVFDVARHPPGVGLPARPTWAERVEWLNALTPALPEPLRVLPTARTESEKAAMFQAIWRHKGEGVVVKHRRALYEPDRRVRTVLKIKFVSTADCVVLERDRGGKSNMVLGLRRRDGTFGEVGQCSAIGKPDARPGDVVEVRYLYAGSGARLVQPTVLRVRDDKPLEDCGYDQLRFTSKAVSGLDYEVSPE